MSQGQANARLLALLTQRSFSRRRVVLASGKESDFFIDCKQTVLLAEGHSIAGAALHDTIVAMQRPIDAVAGVVLGGCPLASAVALISFQRGAPVDAVYVRKATKGHGSARRVEGDSGLAQGASIVVVEDVVTTGGSTLEAIGCLRERGYSVGAVVALVDRLEGGAEALAAAGVEFRALYTRADFLDA